MNFEFETQGTHTYLVYTIKDTDSIDGMSLGMITNNKIPGLAHSMFMQMDSTKYIKYDVSAKISVEQFFSGQVNKKRLLGVFNGIVDAMLSAEDYMIDISSILLDHDHIFADVTTCETVLICLPIENENAEEVDLSAFFKNIMFSTQFDPTENCDHVAKIINYLNSTPVFSLEDFKKVLESIDSAVPQMNYQSQMQYNQQTQVPPVKPQQVAQKVQDPPNNTQTSQPAPQQMPPQQRPVQQVTPQVQPPVNNSQRPQTPSMNPQGTAQNQAAPSEKKISFWNLMTNYNAENAALYKAQKAAKKSGQPATQPVSQQPNMQRPTGNPTQNGFAVPVQNSSAPKQGFAVPNQNTSAPKQGFAIPGQQPQVSPIQSNPQPTPQPASAHRSSDFPKSTGNFVSKPATGNRPSVANPIPVKIPPIFNGSPVPQGRPMNFGETTVLGGGGSIGETTVLGATPATQAKPHLVRFKNSEKIYLDKPVFRIGKEKSYVDYFIGDNSAISRSHANVITREGQYFIVDTNSTNHTYVNGTMIQSNVETQISHGAKIKLANEEFEFKLY